MKFFAIVLMCTSFAALADQRVIGEFLKAHPLDASGSYNGLDTKGYLDVYVRSQNVHGLVDFIHTEKNSYIISLLDIKLIKSYDPLILSPYPVYSTHILSVAELEKRGQKIQTYGAISSEEGNGFCRAAFGSEYHLSKQNPTSSRKSMNDPWYLESVTCEGPKETQILTK